MRSGCGGRATRSLLQLDALDAIDQLQADRRNGSRRRPASRTRGKPWCSGGILRGDPARSDGHAVRDRSGTGEVSVAEPSTLFPLPGPRASTLDSDRGRSRDPALAALAILGLAVGSFLNVCIHRLPHKAVDRQPPIELSPLRLRAALVRQHSGPELRHARRSLPQCRAPISIRYPIVELVTMVIFVAALRRVRSGHLAGPAAALRVHPDRALRDRSRAPPAAERHHPARYRRRARVQRVAAARPRRCPDRRASSAAACCG